LIPGLTTSPIAGNWKTFFIREGTTNIAQAAADFPTFNVQAQYLIWRDLSGSIAMRWTDILNGSGPFTLKVIGRDTAGNEVPSASFTITQQTASNYIDLSLSSSDTFPRFKSVSNPASTLFNASPVGSSGTVTLNWGGLGNASIGTGTALSAVMNNPGLSVIRCVATDTSGKLTTEGISVPIALRDRCGSPNTEDGGSLAIQSTDVASGNLHLDFSDLSVPSIGIPFVLSRSYNTCPANIFSPTVPQTGKWTFGFEESVEHFQINSSLLPGSEWPLVNYRRADGSLVQFYPGVDGNYHPSTPGNHDMLEEEFNAGTFTIYTSDSAPLVKTFEILDQNTRANAQYRLRSIKNLRGHGLTINYINSSSTKISTVTDQSGRAYTFYYQDVDASTRISRVSDYSGRNVYYDWDSNGNLRTVTDVRGYTTTFNYFTSGNGSKRLQSIRLPRLNFPVSNIDYDAAARVTSIQMPLASAGGVSTTSTTSFGYQVSYTDVTRPGTGNNLRFGLDAIKNVTYFTESFGVANRTTNLTRLGVGDLAGQNYRANDLGLTSQSAPPSSAAAPTSITYAPSGRGLVTQTSNGSGTTLVTYPGSIANAAPGSIPQNLALPNTTTDARNNTFDPQFTATGELSAFLNPYAQGGSITEFYAANGLPRYVDDGRGYITEFQYTPTGDISKIIVPFDPDNANRETIFAYPAGSANRGLPSTITDRKGYQTYMEWDPAGNPTLIRAVSLSIGAGETKDIVIIYDENGNRSSVTDRRNKTTNHDYDDMDRPWRVRQPSPDGVAARPTATTEFDAMGRPTKVTSPNGNITEQVYGTSGNGAGRLESVRAYKSGGGYDTIQSTTYLSDGRTDTVTDGEGITRSYQYKPAPRQHLVHRINEPMPNGNTTYREFEYDENDQTTRETLGTTDPSVTQPLPSTLYQYDNAGRLLTVINVMNGNWGNPNDAAHIRTGVTYYADDQIDTISDPRQQPIKHVYDALGHLSVRRNALPADNEWTYRYDANGNLRYEGFPGNGTYPARTITRSWGVLDRLDSIDYGDGITPLVSFGYDANGNRTSMTDRWGSTSYVYDFLNRPTAITRQLTGLSSQSLGYSYFPGGQLKTLTYPGSRTVTYTYDHLDRMSTVAPWTGGTFNYTWRRNGQLDLLTNPNGTQTDYQYFPSNGRLSRLLTTRSGTTIADQQFTYDPVGNITRIQGDLPLAPPADAAINMTADNANRLATIQGQNVTNDPAGRSRTLPGPLNATTTWEGMDRLSSYTSGGQTSSYTYDGDGVRLSRAISTGSTNRYLIDPTAALPNVVAENDLSNSSQRFYVHGANGLLASIDTSNTVSTYHFSHRGDTLALTNSGGSITESYGYSPYGSTVSSLISSWNPFRLTGRYGGMDEGNGLNFMRARYYMASVGRFMSMDQLDTGNRFSYASSNPLSLVDPSGFAPSPLEAALIAQHIYDPSKKLNAGNWKLSDNSLGGYISEDSSNGYRARVYERSLGNDTIEYVMAFAGTDPSDWKGDLLQDALQHFGLGSAQYKYATQAGRSASEGAGGAELTFVGHSLGGGLANIAAISGNRGGIAFNPAKINKSTLRDYLVEGEYFNSPKIQNYYQEHDFINFHTGKNNLGSNTTNYTVKLNSIKVKPYRNWMTKKARTAIDIYNFPTRFQAHGIGNMIGYFRSLAY
jgi:RHS repeat-associated protein